MAIGAEQIGWAYRMILGREPSPFEIDTIGAEPNITIDVLRLRLLRAPEIHDSVGPVDRFLAERDDRRRQVLEYITPQQTGIEIGPWFNPLCPASAGYRCMTADVRDRDALIVQAVRGGIPRERAEEIATVDFVGSASNLDVSVAEKNLLGTFDYVVSSHNLEHIPDPLRFLQACQKVLKPGGTISLALPDRRAGGDYLRGSSTTGEVLEAWWQKRVHPSPAQIFAHVSMNVSNTGLSDQARWRVSEPVTGLTSTSSIHEAMRIAREHVEDRLTEYFDAHCWVFTPASIRLLIEDLRALGLVDLSIRKIVSTGGHEFFVHLVNDAAGAGSPATTMTAGERVALILDIAQETARLG